MNAFPFDQARLYSEKRFKPAWFHAAEVEANAARRGTLEVPPAIAGP